MPSNVMPLAYDGQRVAGQQSARRAHSPFSEMNFVVGPTSGSPDVRMRFRNVMTDQKQKAAAKPLPAAQPRVATVSESQLLTVSPLKPAARQHQAPKHLSSQAFVQHHPNGSQCIRPRTTVSKSQA